MSADLTAPSPADGPLVGTPGVKRGMAEMLKGGVIMDVVTAEQARIAEDAGAVAVMALERVPADIRAQGGVARMSDPDLIQGIVDAVSIPVMAKARIGHTVEAQILQHLGVGARLALGGLLGRFQPQLLEQDLPELRGAADVELVAGDCDDLGADRRRRLAGARRRRLSGRAIRPASPARPGNRPCRAAAARPAA